ncbi:MAG: sigma-54-dependent Fis family transcriptional regulator [Desulfuromonadales bacterium]|nr:sigma-54-dependent Fis family transcriptional regulator [Desulfuromonadales bacterium]MBN2791382.1 sigma-54-dependent Fis family transcriptional regulator [Desulfuromonadales bacterium]
MGLIAEKELVQQARRYFFDGVPAPAGLVSDIILSSWERSRAHGIAVEQDPADLPVLSAATLNEAKQAGNTLTAIAGQVMEHLYGQIRQTSSMVLLTDAAGTILRSIGDSDFVDKARRVSLQPGGVWSEAARGTNAIGTCLIEQSPVIVHREEHFAASNHFLTCSATPIFDPFGRILGVLDVSGDGTAYQLHTMALVRISAQQIENMMFSLGFDDNLTLHFHSHPHFIGTFYEGIIVFNSAGELLAANRSALLQLGLDRYSLRGTVFEQLFDFPFADLPADPRMSVQPLLELRGPEDRCFYVRVRPHISRAQGTATLVGESGSRTVAGGTAKNLCLKLESLSLGDQQMTKAVRQSVKALHHDIPLLIEGESGTGKELLARALHGCGPRAKGPFVAVNCAAIPAGLIESELFGYRDGAFTGASRKGYTGKIRQADGGILFLDEIGDMPLELQAMLLRVLQERKVSPLGGEGEQAVNIGLVCATNRNISDDVKSGRFREDLYYRLNGLRVRLPPLRQRNDRLLLAEKLLNELLPRGRQLQLSHSVAELFEKHPWPGNIRQLHSLLRTTCVLLEEHEMQLEIDHLPEDFLEQIEISPQTDGPDRITTVLPPISAAATDLEQLQLQAIHDAVRVCSGNISAAARRLGVSRSTLYRKINGKS